MRSPSIPGFSWRRVVAAMGIICLLAFLAASVGWQGKSRLKEVSVPEAGFAAQMPGSPEKEARDIDGRHVTAFAVKEEDGGFSVLYADGPKLTNPTKAELRDHFEQWRKNFAADTDAKVKQDRDADLDGKYPGHFWEIEITGKPIKIQIRAILANGKTYVLVVTGLSSWNGWADAETFFKSFRLLSR